MVPCYTCIIDATCDKICENFPIPVLSQHFLPPKYYARCIRFIQEKMGPKEERVYPGGVVFETDTYSNGKIKAEINNSRISIYDLWSRVPIIEVKPKDGKMEFRFRPGHFVAVKNENVITTISRDTFRHQLDPMGIGYEITNNIYMKIAQEGDKKIQMTLFFGRGVTEDILFDKIWYVVTFSGKGIMTIKSKGEGEGNEIFDVRPETRTLVLSHRKGIRSKRSLIVNDESCTWIGIERKPHKITYISQGMIIKRVENSTISIWLEGRVHFE